MTRHVEFWGAAQNPQLETFRPNLPVWPDIDRPASGAPGVYSDTVLHQIGDLRGVALAADTDWDQVLARFSNERDWRLLTPGMILTPQPPAAATGLEVAPAVRTPSTRLYDAAALRGLRNTTPQPLTAWGYNPVGSEMFNDSFVNISSVAQPIWRWTATGWVQQANVAAGTSASGVYGRGNTGPLAASNRASDWSPDGIFSFADYMELTVMPLGPMGNQIGGGVNTGVAYVSAAPVDAHGHAGDPTNPTAIKYSTAIANGLWASIDQRWYGKLAIECWQGECPPQGYRPPLAPERVITLGAITVPPNPAAGAGPQTAVLTVPALNIDEVQFTFRVGAGASVYVAIGSPLADEGIDTAARILTTGYDTAYAANGGGGVLRGENVHDFIQIVVGSPQGGAAGSLLAGSQLILRRRHLG